MDLMEMRMRQQPHHWCADMVPEKRIDLPVLPPVTSQAGWRKYRHKRNQRNHQIQGYEVFNPNTNKLENDQRKMLLQLPWSYAEAVKKPNNKQANLSLSKDEDQMEDQSEKPTVGINGANSNGQDLDEDSPLNPDAMEFIPIATSSDKDEMTVSATTTTTDNENEDIEPLEENQLKPLPVDTLETISTSGNYCTETKIIDEVNGNIETDDGDVIILDQESCEVRENDASQEEASPTVVKELQDRAELHEADEKEIGYDPFSPIPQNNDHEDKTESNDQDNETVNCDNTEKNNLFGNELDFDELVKNKADYSESHFGENEYQENLKNSSTENGEILKIGFTDDNHFSEEEMHKSFALSVESNHSEELNKSAEIPFEDEKENHLDSNPEKMEIQTNGYLNEIHYEEMEIKECQELLEKCDRLEGINLNDEDLDCQENSEKAEVISSAEGFSDFSNKEVMESSLFMDDNLLNESNDQDNSDKSQIDSEELPELQNNQQEEEISQKVEFKHTNELEGYEETSNIDNLNNSNKFDIDENFFSNEVNTCKTFEVKEDIADENIEKNNFNDVEDHKNDTEDVEATETSMDTEKTDNILNDSYEDNKENIDVKEFNLSNSNFDENTSTESENQRNENVILDDMNSSRDETNDNDSSFEIINDCLENNIETLEHNQGISSNEEENDKIFDADKSFYECFNSDSETINQSNIKNVDVLKNESLQKHFAENEESHEGFGPLIDSDVSNTFENHHTESDCEQDKIIEIKTSESECETSAEVYQVEFEQHMTKEDNEVITSLPQLNSEAHLNNSSEEITPVEESLGSEITLQDKTYQTPQDDYVPSENTAESLILMNEEHTLSDQKFYEEDVINTEVAKDETNIMSNEIFESTNSETISECNGLCKEDTLMESEQTQDNQNYSIVDDEKTAEEAEDEATNTNQIVEYDQVDEVYFNQEDDKHQSDILNKEQNYDEKEFIIPTVHESKESNIEDVSLESINVICEDPCETTDVSIQETCINEQIQTLNEVQTDETPSEHLSEINEMNICEEKTSTFDEEIIKKDIQELNICEADENKEENQFAVELTPDENTEILPTTETKELNLENCEITTEIKEENNDLIQEDIAFIQEIENLPEKSTLQNTEINSIREENSAFSSTSAEETQHIEELIQVENVEVLPTNEMKESDLEQCEISDDLKEENNDLVQDLKVNLKTNDSPLEEEVQGLENKIANDSEVTDLKSDDSLNTSETTGTIIAATAAAAIAAAAVGATVASGVSIANDSNETPDTDKNIVSDDSLTKLLDESTEEAKDKKTSTAVKSSPKKTVTQTSLPNKPSSPVSSKAKTAVGKAASQPIKSPGSATNALSKSSTTSTTKSQSTPKPTASQTKAASTTSKPGTPTTKSTGPLKSAVAPIKAAAVSKTTSKPTTTTTKSSVSKPAALTKPAVSSTKTTTSSNKTTAASLPKSGAPASAKSSATASGKPAAVGAVKSSKTPTLTNGLKSADTTVNKPVPPKPGTPTSKPSTPTTKSTISTKPSAAKPTSGTAKLSASSTTAKTAATKPSSPTTKTSSTPTKAPLSSASKVASTKSSGDASKMSSSKTSTIKPSTPPSKPTPSKSTSAALKNPPITKKPGSPVKPSAATSSVTKSSVSEINGNKNSLKSSVNSSASKTTLKANPAPKGGLTKQVTETTDKGKVAPNKTSPSSVKRSPNAVKKLATSDKNSKNVSKSPTHQKDQVETKEDESVTSTTEDFPIENSFVIENLPPQISV